MEVMTINAVEGKLNQIPQCLKFNKFYFVSKSSDLYNCKILKIADSQYHSYCAPSVIQHCTEQNGIVFL